MINFKFNIDLNIKEKTEILNKSQFHEILKSFEEVGILKFSNLTAKPENLVNILKKYDCELDALHGMKFNLIKDKWSISSDKSINYIGKFIKN